MKRRLNFTNRKKIRKQDVEVQLKYNDGIPTHFLLKKLNVNNLDIPGDSLGIIEAYHRSELGRFELGTLDKLQLPKKFSLKGLSSKDSLKYRIFFVDQSNKKILAYVDGISPMNKSKEDSILPVDYKDLGNKIWEISFDGDNGAPMLILNNKIPDIKNIALSNTFKIFVYPYVFKEILYHMIFIDGIDSIEEPLIDWHSKWLEFAKQLGNKPSPLLEKKDLTSSEREEVLEWIEYSVNLLCDKFSGDFKEYVDSLINGGDYI